MELEDMGRIVTAVLEFAESRAKRHIPMTMEDWAKRIDAYLNTHFPGGCHKKCRNMLGERRASSEQKEVNRFCSFRKNDYLYTR
jgi:hypothetical protein